MSFFSCHHKSLNALYTNVKFQNTECECLLNAGQTIGFYVTSFYIPDHIDKFRLFNFVQKKKLYFYSAFGKEMEKVSAKLKIKSSTSMKLLESKI